MLKTLRMIVRSVAFSALLLVMNFAQAGTPSFIGPWVYEVDYYQPIRTYSSQGAAMNAVLQFRKEQYAAETIKTTKCNFQISPPPFSYSPSTSVEGVDSYAVVFFSIDVEIKCDGSPLSSPPTFFEVGNILSAIGMRRVVCSSTQHYYDGLCLDVVPFDVNADKGKNFGPPCDCNDQLTNPSVGQPINLSTGNMWHVERDYRAETGDSPLALVRTYNSARLRPGSTDATLFGKRWSFQYDVAITPTLASTGSAGGRCWRLYYYPEKIICDNPATPPDPVNAVSISRGDGKSIVYQRQANNVWLADADTNARLAATLAADGAIADWTFSSENGNIERFDGEGKLLSITTRTGQTQRLTYSTGETNDTSVSRAPVDAPACSRVQPGAPLAKNRLLCVTDQWGRQLQFNYDAAGRIAEAIDPANQSTHYEYDGVSGGCTPDLPGAAACKAGNLTKVTYPDGASRTYVYNERPRINTGNRCTITPPPLSTTLGPLPNAMTGLVDENGARHISWTYNCSELATSSELAGGVEKVTLSYTYDPSSKQFIATIYDFVGDPAAPRSANVAFFAKPIQGVFKNTSLTGPCAECGTIKSHTYDANGNVASAKDFLDKQTTYQYDLGRNLQTSRTEAAGTTEARTISTEWHPVFRLPARMAEPKRLTTYNYDAAGNLSSKTEEATSDLTGAAAFAAAKTGKARTWRYTYNQLGQLMTTTGPRTDQLVQTSYTYDAMGNLDSVTDPLGRKTLLSNYDANGLVGRIAAPNGTVTELTYTPRGWLASKSVTSGALVETTLFSYDAAGQLRKLTLPDQSSIDYSYDDAHRLVRVSDSLGNSINYALDLRGNRTREQTVDPDGVLQRQISRQYNDYNNQLYKVTGGAL